MSADQHYERLVKKAGLYGQAFFGHRNTNAGRKKLSRLWNKAVQLEARDQEKISKIAERYAKALSREVREVAREKTAGRTGETAPEEAGTT